LYTHCKQAKSSACHAARLAENRSLHINDAFISAAESVIMVGTEEELSGFRRHWGCCRAARAGGVGIFWNPCLL